MKTLSLRILSYAGVQRSTFDVQHRWVSSNRRTLSTNKIRFTLRTRSSFVSRWTPHTLVSFETSYLVVRSLMMSWCRSAIRFIAIEVFMGDGKRKGEKAFVGYPRGWVVYVYFHPIRLLMVESGSRKPNHLYLWITGSQPDMNSFVESFCVCSLFYIPSPFLHAARKNSNH